MRIYPVMPVQQRHQQIKAGGIKNTKPAKEIKKEVVRDRAEVLATTGAVSIIEIAILALMGKR